MSGYKQYLPLLRQSSVEKCVEEIVKLRDIRSLACSSGSCISEATSLILNRQTRYQSYDRLVKAIVVFSRKSMRSSRWRYIVSLVSTRFDCSCLTGAWTFHHDGGTPFSITTSMVYLCMKETSNAHCNMKLSIAICRRRVAKDAIDMDTRSHVLPASLDLSWEVDGKWYQDRVIVQ